MKSFFGNVWTKRAVSLLCPVYVLFVGVFAYLSIYYDMVLKDPKQCCLLLSLISVIALIIMLYTRDTLLTKLCSILILPGMLLPILFYFGQWWVLVPPFVLGLIMLFFSGMSETGKTIWGTVILLLYLIGSLVYFVVTSLFAPSTVATVVETGTSKSGMYRYTVTQTMDSSSGSTKVTVESNELNRDYDLVQFQVKGLSRDVVVERPLNEQVEIKWDTATRDEIMQEIKAISKDVTVDLSDAQMKILGRDSYKVTYPNGEEVTMGPEAFHALMYPLTEEDREVLHMDEPEMHVDEMGERSFKQLGIQVDDLRKVKFSELTNEDLDKLGIPQEGDVMTYNGKVVFRYYIAVLEQYFDISKQDLGFF
ncbi:MAG: hypothetical protein K6F80_02165 [Oscillospiraceae bacterium]|nr:hypothetical protein [Oscillospiraceae bacterium]